MPQSACVDASVALMLVLEDPLTHAAESLWQEWIGDETHLLVPPLFHAEVTSVIRNYCYRAEIAVARGMEVLAEALTWPVSVFDPGSILQETALRLATDTNQPRGYDAQYLAVAHLLGCEFWTGDQRLVQSVSDKLPWVRWVGEYQPA